MVLAGYAPAGEEELLAVMNAMILSIICMFLILPLDWLADQSWTDDKCDLAIRSIMSAMGILIGFAWEQCFDASVDSLATKAGNEGGVVNVHTTKLALTLFCVGLLVPAWKMYIIPFMVQQGWTADYPLRIAVKSAKGLAKSSALNPDDKETSEQDKKDTLDALKKLKKHAKRMVAAVNPGTGLQLKIDKLEAKLKGGVVTGQSEAQLEAKLAGLTGGGAAYTPLAASPGDAEGLKKENASLRSRLQQAESDKLKAQQLLDATMNGMLKSMKTMHATVDRIENS